MADFDSGWARVIARGDEHHNRVGRVLEEELTPSGLNWVTLEIDGKEVMFERRELMPCPAPQGGSNG